MSKWHYYIVSKSKAKIEKTDETEETVTIKKAILIEENKKIKKDDLSFLNGKEDAFLNVALIIPIIILAAIVAAMILLRKNKDIESTVYSFADNFMTSTGFIIALISFQEVRLKINGFLKFGAKGNKIMIVFVILLLSLFMTIPISTVKFNNIVSIISYICLLASIKSYFCS